MAVKSLFMLSYEDVTYNSDFWQIFVYLLIFVIVVDTIGHICERFSEGDRVTEMFVRRLNTEVLMFGSIALVIFFLDQGIDPLYISDKTQKLIKFADIVVSLSAIFLILVGCWAYVLLLRSRRHYHELTVRRMSEWAHPEEHAKKNTAGHECLRRLGYGRRLQEDIDFLVGAGNITLMLHAPLDVEFGAYCSEVVGQVIINLIDINPISWSLFLATTCSLFGVTYKAGYYEDSKLPVIVCTVAGVLMFIASSVLVVVVRMSQHNLRKLYGYDMAHEKELQAVLDEEVELEVEMSMRSEDCATSTYSAKVSRAAARSEPAFPVRPSRDASYGNNANTDIAAYRMSFNRSACSGDHGGLHHAGHHHAGHGHAAHSHETSFHSQHAYETHVDEHARMHQIYPRCEEEGTRTDGSEPGNMGTTKPFPPRDRDSPSSTVATEDDLLSPIAPTRPDDAHAYRLKFQSPSMSGMIEHNHGHSLSHDHPHLGYSGAPPIPFVTSQRSGGQQSVASSMHSCAPSRHTHHTHHTTHHPHPSPPPSMHGGSMHGAGPPSVDRVPSLPTYGPALVDLHSKERSKWLQASQHISKRLRDLDALSQRISKRLAEPVAVTMPVPDVAVTVPVAEVMASVDAHTTPTAKHTVDATANALKHTSTLAKMDIHNEAKASKKKRGVKDLAPPIDGFTEPPPLSLKLWVARHMHSMGQLLQTVMLLTCGLLAWYVVHLIYNINKTDIGAGWHVACTLPPLITLLILLPDAVHHFGVFEAYAVPNVSVLDHVLNDAEQREADLRLLRHGLEQRLCTPCWPEYLRAFADQYKDSARERYGKLLLDLARGRTDFFVQADHCFVQAILAAAKIDMSRQRLIRIIEYIDEELEGEDISLDGLLSVVGLSMPPIRIEEEGEQGQQQQQQQLQEEEEEERAMASNVCVV